VEWDSWIYHWGLQIAVVKVLGGRGSMSVMPTGGECHSYISKMFRESELERNICGKEVVKFK
jgi:hypothetical protein